MFAGFGAGLAVYAGWRQIRRWRRGKTYDHPVIERALKCAGEALPHSAWLTSPSGGLIWINKKWLDYAGGTFADYEGRVARDTVHPDYAELVARAWEEACRTERSFECSCPLRRGDDSYRWFLVRAEPIRSARGDLICWFGSNTDIHERVESEARQREETEILHALADAIPQLLWRTNPDGEADFFSRSFLKFLVAPPESVLGWGWIKLIHPEDRGRVVDEWKAAREAERDVSVEFRIKTPLRGYRWFISHGKPFRDQNGKVIKYYGTWTDIDDLKSGQRELRRALGVRDEFISLASHELKTPITSMKLQTQMLDKRRCQTVINCFSPEVSCYTR